MWLREAERAQIWKPLGMVSALDYMERVLGHTPHVAHERLRVARALGDLPALELALARGELSFSAIRELTRVATPETELAWRDRAVGRNVREIEELVAGHARGDHPDDPPKPEAREHELRYRVTADVYALLRETVTHLTGENGKRLGDSELIAAFCNAVREGGATGEPRDRAKFQIAVTVCSACKQGWQHGGGVKVPIDAAAVERAECDAQHIGSIDADAHARAAQDIPPSVARFVWHRDGGRCQTPGCRSSVGLEIHHIIRRVDGGTHEPSNLRVQCSACHMAIHRGTLVIDNRGETLEARRPMSHVGSPAKSHVGPPKLDLAIMRTQARDALIGLGWKSPIARAAVDDAIAHGTAETTLESLIREALRRCPAPKT
jgi:hypothetical protein